MPKRSRSSSPPRRPRGFGVLLTGHLLRKPCKWRTLPGGFQGPFHFDGISFIWDANGEMAADFVDEDGNRRSAVRARGWGRIQYMPNPDAEMDAWEAWVAQTAGGVADPEEAVRLFNTASG